MTAAPVGQSRLGTLVRLAREQRGLTVEALAAWLGFRQLVRGGARLTALERHGRGSEPFLRRVAAALELDPAEVDRHLTARRDEHRRRATVEKQALAADQARHEAWLDTPVKPRVIGRLDHGEDEPVTLPWLARSVGAAEKFGRKLAARGDYAAVFVERSRREATAYLRGGLLLYRDYRYHENRRRGLWDEADGKSWSEPALAAIGTATLTHFQWRFEEQAVAGWALFPELPDRLVLRLRPTGRLWTFGASRIGPGAVPGQRVSSQAGAHALVKLTRREAVTVARTANVVGFVYGEARGTVERVVIEGTLPGETIAGFDAPVIGIWLSQLSCASYARGRPPAAGAEPVANHSGGSLFLRWLVTDNAFEAGLQRARRRRALMALAVPARPRKRKKG